MAFTGHFRENKLSTANFGPAPDTAGVLTDLTGFGGKERKRKEEIGGVVIDERISERTKDERQEKDGEAKRERRTLEKFAKGPRSRVLYTACFANDLATAIDLSHA